MTSSIRLGILVAIAVVTVGCGADSSKAANPGQQDVAAKMLGIATPSTVQQNQGAYTPDVNLSKTIVGAQNAKIAKENAAIQNLTNGPH